MSEKSTSGSSGRRCVFICYNVKDKVWLDQLLLHLEPQRRDEGLEIFFGEEIEFGSDWRAEIQSALQRARIAILLVSPHFMASKFIAKEELPPLLLAAEDDLVKIVPLWLQPSDWDKRLTAFQGANPLRPTFSEMQAAEVDRRLVKLSQWIRQEMKKVDEGDGHAAASSAAATDAGKSAAVPSSATMNVEKLATLPAPKIQAGEHPLPRAPDEISAKPDPHAQDLKGGIPSQSGGSFSIGLGLLLLLLLGGGLLAGRQLSGQSTMIWWLLAMAAFALLATAVSAGLGGAMGVWQSREAKLVGPPAVFVVIFTTLLGGSHLLARAEWQARGTITGLPPGKAAEVYLGQCHPRPIDLRTGQFSVTVTSDCDADPLSMTVLVADCAPQRESISKQDARAGIEKQWRGVCGATRFVGRVVGKRGAQIERLPAKVWIWPVKCPELRGDTNDRNLFSIEHVPPQCQAPPFRFAYRMDGVTKMPVAGELTAPDPLDILIEIPLPEAY
ncbi:MAG: toll/interleukin-1 receptor domain-containing protein [Myxococcales bacterium]|nr:toll/interleukin-1 receptor domain-containing protein [Myxococcales bacterium]